MAGGGENDNSLSFIENSPPFKRHKGTHNTVRQYLCYGCPNMYRFTNSGERDGLAEDSHAGLQAKAVAFSRCEVFGKDSAFPRCEGSM